MQKQDKIFVVIFVVIIAIIIGSAIYFLRTPSAILSQIEVGK